jgi:hypothetical protein
MITEHGGSGDSVKRKCDRMELASSKQLIANNAIEYYRKEEVK